jgi:hypothetical protein
MTATQDAAGQDAPQIMDLPIGLTSTGTRRETDSMGVIDVPAVSAAEFDRIVNPAAMVGR